MRSLVLRALTSLQEIAEPLSEEEAEEERDPITCPRLFEADGSPPDLRAEILAADFLDEEVLPCPLPRPDAVDAMLEYFELLRTGLMLMSCHWARRLRKDPACLPQVRRDIRRTYADSARHLLDLLLRPRQEPPAAPAASVR